MTDRRVPVARGDRGFTMIELLIVIGLISVIAAFAIPRLLRARMAANEAATIASMKAVTTAELVYSKTCGGGGYAVSFPVLGVSPPGTTMAFLTPDLTIGPAPIKSGYTYGLTSAANGVAGPDDCSGTPTETAYYLSAVPTAFGFTGDRSFATSGLPIIWQVNAATAPTEPFGSPARPIQ
jgi:prepilin-type N-terminal cleavage/methylation domain-containing protein